jgi:DNA-directed RNA polymerase beta' subunit
LVEVGADLEKAGSLERGKVQKRYNLVKSMKRANVRPEWMFMSVIPVIPPDLRPMVALDGGRHATVSFGGRTSLNYMLARFIFEYFESIFATNL